MSLKPKRVDFNATWGHLKKTIGGVITLDHVPKPDWNDRFMDVYSLCVAHPESMADKLYAETKQYLIDHVSQLLLKVEEDGDQGLIRNYYTYWTQYSKGVHYLHILYQYLNQQHIKTQKMSDAEIIYGSDPQGAGQMEIGELALEVWKIGMIKPIGPKLVNLLLAAIQQDRDKTASSVPYEAVRETILSFVEVQEFKKKDKLSLYRENFEIPFLDKSGEYYQTEAGRLLEGRNVSLYMEKVLQKIEEELFRARKFLHPSSVSEVVKRCEQHMVSEHQNFLYSECQEMVKEERITDLSNLYKLLKSVPNALNKYIDIMLEHIKSQGLDAIGNLQGENVHINFVENLLTVYKKYRQQIQVVFNGDQNFMGALDKACSFVVNYRPQGSKHPCRSAELLAKYCDTMLKKSSKTISEQEIEEKLAQSITIFKYIDDKDVFQKFYSRMLAKRLIHGLTQSMDAEETMINRLKQACGYEFTSKLHRMFTDMSVSADLNNKFNSYLKQENFDLGINFTIHVLQAGAWPLGQAVQSSFALPQQLEKSVQMFEAFYHNKFNGRKLTWLHHLCQAELRLGYLKRPYIVTVQTFQMAILLLFETTDALTCKEIRDTLQLAPDVFQRHAVSLVESKILLLPEGITELVPEAVLRLNKDYSNKRTRFRITAAVQKEQQQEVEHTINSVEEDRKLYLQAAIVRIMKSRKVLKHNALIQEVCAQSKVSFAPSIPMIKKCIEALIDKQYIERAPHSSEEYSYVA